jgi:interferon-induced GTP-binding protein Mx1
VDIATVEILGKAKVVDPEGNRTIGVLTKPDLVDVGAESEVMSVLQNLRKPLKLGYIMVKNRNHQEVERGTDMAEARATESAYFRDHSAYQKMPVELFGVQNLTNRLTTVLVGRIHSQIPEMKNELIELLKETKVALDALGVAPPDSPGAQFQAYEKVKQTFITLYSDAIKGRYNDAVFVTDQSLSLCADACKQFRLLKTEIDYSKPKFSSADFLEMLEKQLSNCRGRELPGFLSVPVFTKIMSSCINDWRKPSLACLEVIRQKSVEVCQKLIEHLVPSHTRVLAQVLSRKVEACIVETARKAAADINEATDREIEEPFTQNHYYMDTVNKLRCESFNEGLQMLLDPLQRTITPDSRLPESSYPAIRGSSSDICKTITAWYSSSIGDASNEAQEAIDMDIALQSYWKVAGKNFADNIPKIIQKSFLDDLQKQLQFILVCMDLEEIRSYFASSEHLQNKRRALNAKVDRLEQASLKLEYLPIDW